MRGPAGQQIAADVGFVPIAPLPAQAREFGILALVVGSVSVTGLAMAISVPIGIVAAIFISESPVSG